MTRLLIALLLALSASPTLAEGPGTRIRSGSQLPQPPILQRAPDACARLHGAERERCIQNERRPAPAGNVPGPGSVSGTSGARSSSASGTSGASPLGAGVPR
jgi:hypothetical protein